MSTDGLTLFCFFAGMVIGLGIGTMSAIALNDEWGWQRTREEHDQWEREKLKKRLAELDKPKEK